MAKELAGKMRNLVEVRARQAVSDLQGGQQFQWVFVKTIWVEVLNARTTSELLRNLGDIAVANGFVSIWCWRNDLVNVGVLKDLWLVLDGVDYLVEGLMEQNDPARLLLVLNRRELKNG